MELADELKSQIGKLFSRWTGHPVPWIFLLLLFIYLFGDNSSHNSLWSTLGSLSIREILGVLEKFYAMTLQDFFLLLLLALSINAIFRLIRKRAYQRLTKIDAIKIKVESAREKLSEDVSSISDLVPVLKKVERDISKKTSSLLKNLTFPEVCFSIVLISCYGFCQFPNWIDATGIVLSLILTYYFLRKSVKNYIENLLPDLVLKAVLINRDIPLGKFG